MEIKNYAEEYFNDVFEVVHKTIEGIYPKYYPKSAVDFFHNHHSKENMEKQLPNEFTLLLMDNNMILGAGTLFENEIKRFFILPEYQGKGYGKILLENLEKNIDKNKYDTFILASSLGAVEFYRRNNYVYKEYKTINLPDGDYLCYLEMYKNINANYQINYDNKIFVSIGNSKNGEVNEETLFHYHQNKDIIWGEYSGGIIKKGFLLGFVKENGELEFNYEHININNETRTGKCNSSPKILENGYIELLEKWEWTNGDKSKGESKIKEIGDNKSRNNGT
jgi:GNAT superfamily N-acetyltransferase